MDSTWRFARPRTARRQRPKSDTWSKVLPGHSSASHAFQSGRTARSRGTYSLQRDASSRVMANSRVLGSPTALNHRAPGRVSKRIKLKKGLAWNCSKRPPHSKWRGTMAFWSHEVRSEEHTSELQSP